MSHEDVERRLRQIRETVTLLGDHHSAAVLERELLFDAIEAVIRNRIDLETLKEVTNVATIQFRRWPLDG